LLSSKPGGILARMDESEAPGPASKSVAERSADALAPLAPIEAGAPVVRDHDAAAGGIAAISSSVGYTLREAGLERGTASLLRVNQEDGFDCPSCAWPDPHDRAPLEFCENGARAVADEATRARVTPEFFAEHSVDDLLAKSDHWLNKQGRLTHPMVLREGSRHYEPISWDEAFRVVAQELRALGDPDRAIFYTSGRTSNEAAFAYQLFVRQFGTNNMPDCSNMCHESSGAGLSRVIGIGKGTVLLDDFDAAEAIFVIGQNPGTNHPRMLTALRNAKKNGCKIVSINPLREAGLVRFKHPQKLGDMLGRGVGISDLYLRVRVGGDIALLKGIMKAMLEAERQTGGVFDYDFIAEHTTGYEALVHDLDATSWQEVVIGSGVPEAEIRAAAEIAIRSRATIACWAMGITQHKHGVANVQSIVNFLLLRGNMGKPGAGACPVRGHSNVQGDRTMGIWEVLPSWGACLGELFAFDPPRESGYDTVGAIGAMHEGRADVFFALGGNFLSASPDTDFTARALQRCRLTVQVSTKLNRSHLVTGRRALILPCLGRTERDVPRRADGVSPRGEQFVTVENSMGVVHRSRGGLEPASEHLLSEVQIVCRLAHATLGSRSRVQWQELAVDYDRIRDAIARVVPGFDDYNVRVRHEGGFTLPNGPRERRFATADGKAHFTVHPLPDIELPPGRFWMTTVRSHDQFNTTVYDLDDRYRGIHGHRRVVLVNPQDLESQGLDSGQKITLVSHFAGQTRRAPAFTIVAYDIVRGNVATYFPEANPLVFVDSYADVSRTPTSKAIEVSLHPE
jgi:molybdopterin-dependent oxidoreductase alpha subunit